MPLTISLYRSGFVVYYQVVRVIALKKSHYILGFWVLGFVRDLDSMGITSLPTSLNITQFHRPWACRGAFKFLVTTGVLRRYMQYVLKIHACRDRGATLRLGGTN